MSPSAASSLRRTNPLHANQDVAVSLRQAADPLFDLGRGDARVRQPEAGPTPVEHEARPFYELDLTLGGGSDERVDVRPLGEVEPQEVPTLGLDEARLGQLAAERLAKGLGALPERYLDSLDRSLKRTAEAELMDDRLRDHARRDVGAGGDLDHPCDQLGGADEVTDSDSRADGLGERRRVHHGVPVHRKHRWQRRALEPQRRVRVILEDREVVRARELEQRLTLRLREGAARRVLE